eukprot:5195290-Amphidinium_carterae.2
MKETGKRNTDVSCAGQCKSGHKGQQRKRCYAGPMPQECLARGRQKFSLYRASLPGLKVGQSRREHDLTLTHLSNSQGL